MCYYYYFPNESEKFTYQEAPVMCPSVQIRTICTKQQQKSEKTVQLLPIQARVHCFSSIPVICESFVNLFSKTFIVLSWGVWEIFACFSRFACPCRYGISYVVIHNIASSSSHLKNYGTCLSPPTVSLRRLGKFIATIFTTITLQSQRS